MAGQSKADLVAQNKTAVSKIVFFHSSFSRHHTAVTPHHSMDPRWRYMRAAIKNQGSTVAWLTTARSPRDVQLTLLAVAYFLVCVFVNCIGNSIADRINPNQRLPVEERKPLPDWLMESTHHLYKAAGLPANLSDQLIIVSLIAILLRALTLQSMTSTVARRLLFVMGTAYAMRAVSVTVTVLPNPLVECESVPHPNVLVDAVQLMMMQRVSCGDVFFSGHTIIFTLLVAMWTTYSRNRFYRALFSAIGYAGMLSLVTSAYHYTIDVLAGFMVTMWVWAMYHWAVMLPSLRQSWWAQLVLHVDRPSDMSDARPEEVVLPTIHSPLPTGVNNAGYMSAFDEFTVADDE